MSKEEQPGAVAPQSSFTSGSGAIPQALDKVRNVMGGNTVPPAPPPAPGEEEDGDDDGMLRMSFMEHLEELRSRLLRMLTGIAVAAVASLTFSNQLWNFVRQPARQALKSLNYPEDLVITQPMEGFNIIWFKLPLLCAIFLSSPWILYQVWSFIAPGLYRRERRWAAPFVIGSAGLFILGGVFAYFVVFRFGLTFLLSIGKGNGVVPMVTISEYFSLFMNVVLGVGIVFELPILIFFLTLLRVLHPAFLIRHSRYAILAIIVMAAIITPTPDVFNLMMFAAPMCLLFYVGVFASYLLILKRDNLPFPWRIVLTILAVLGLILGVVTYLMVTRYGYRLVPSWPFLIG
jgi:sec-independent protein translocase protein TatC